MKTNNKPITKQKIEKDTKETLRKDLNKSCEKIVTLKLAIKGLMGDISGCVTDKLIEICGEISLEQNRIKLLQNMLEEN